MDPKPRFEDGQRRSSAVRLFVATVMAVAFGCAELSAWEPDDGRWSLGVHALLVAPDDERSSFTTDGEPADYGLDGEGAGFEIMLDFRASHHIGFSLGAGLTNLDMSVRGAGSDPAVTESATFEIYTAGADWFFTPERNWDLRAGIFIAQSKLDDVIVTLGGAERKFTFDDDYGFGARVGVDWPVTNRWTVSGDVRYLKTILESDSGASDLSIDPFIVAVGLKFRL